MRATVCVSESHKRSVALFAQGAILCLRVIPVSCVIATRAMAGVSLNAIDVAPQIRALIETDYIERDLRFVPATAGQAGPTKVSPKVNADGVTTEQDAVGGCDGIKNGRWGFHTASGESDPWWQVDLGNLCTLGRVVVFNRTDRNTAPRTRNLRILVAERLTTEDKHFKLVYQHEGSVFHGVKENKPLVVSLKDKGVTARVIRLDIKGSCSFALDEVEVYASGDPTKNIALGRPADQKSVGRYSYPGTLPEGVDSASPPRLAPKDGGFSLAHTRSVVECARKLLARPRSTANAGRLEPNEVKLKELEERLSKLEKESSVTLEVRRGTYLEACWLKRKIAFCNPLLGFDRILFIKRHDAGGVFHMCDQYYGCNAKPGGGLFVLCDPFTNNPKLINLLEKSVVEQGRLKGQKLDSGSFLSPELSFEGKTILFAYSEAKAKQTYQWAPEFSYHLFRCNADGTGLVQLTDGAWDDFDPCLLPNGRIVFISERRGGYLRCGRHCPVYTMFSMEADGSDIACLSFHETHEWHPSVANDGRIVYTRWDYVDRDTNIAHHLWLCYPDGRDPRSFHGNYPVKRESRPWMEMNVRAIPGSHKFVAVTGAHHGHAFGSLVLIDHSRPDDLAASQIERLTPEAPFPEAEGRPISSYMVYGTPWPLSEDDYLCVYDPRATNRGLYWIDRFGNKELVYRDPAISCLSPIPLRPRPRPPILPEDTTQTARARKAAGGDRPATIAVMNVYDSDFEWPKDTKIAALRIVQLLPKSTAPPNQPRIGVAEQTNARAVLGTVPVEADGSAYFEAPVGKPIYFQALDGRGLAVQSMRSVTYVHPGERLTCRGCHERKHAPPSSRRVRASRIGVRAAAPEGPQPSGLPKALCRPPSRIQPDVEGSNPFNYARLVQPVLDRHCVGCHQQKKTIDLSGKLEGNFTRSYNNIAGRYGFYFHVTNGSINTGTHGGSRTIPGGFGARAAPLLKYLDDRHYGVRLSPEDFHRITLWLDCNSEFLGAYENADLQARGQMVRPLLE